jgi:ornithine cyclodeaminase
MVIDTPTLARLLARVGIEPFLQELADRIEADFARWPQFEKSARLASHSKLGVLELMPSADAEWFSFKLVNGHPGNPSKGLLTVTAIGMLADVATGYPQLISEMTVLTALRTAATSALAARHLANPGCEVMALIGTGAQGEFQALAFKACLGIGEVRYYDIDRAAMQKFARNMQDSGLALIACSSIANAVDGAQIITTATAVKGSQSVMTDAFVRDGIHINAIGGDCPGKTELDPALMARARIFVEYLPQTRIEGDIQNLGPDALATELWQVIVGESRGRTAAEELTIFDSVGFAIEDYSTLRYVYDRARMLGVGKETALISSPPDPKDLFGYIGRLADSFTT